MLDFAANISMLWPNMSLRERLERVREAGFHAFEFLFVTSFGADELEMETKERGLSVELFDLEVGDPTLKGSWGYLCDPGGEELLLESFERGLDDARRLQCKRINALAGRAVPGLAWARQRDLVVERLAKLAPTAAQAGVTLLIEAISPLHLPGYLLTRSSQALEIVDLVGHPNVRFLCDVYHAQLVEGNLISTLRDNISKIGHVQIADVPGRHEPGTGEINYPNVLAALEDAGYRGFVGLEYVPLGPEPFVWMRIP